MAYTEAFGIESFELGIPENEHQIRWHKFSSGGGFVGSYVETRPKVDPDLIREAEIRTVVSVS